MLMPRNKNQEEGRSTIEMLGVLAIIGVLTIGGIAGYSQAMSKHKITKAMDQIQSLIANVRSIYSSQRTYTPLTAREAYDMNILTDETYSKETEKSINTFGGEILFGVSSTLGRSFTVTYTKLSPEACVKLATADWGADKSSGLISITIGSDAKRSDAGIVSFTSGERFVWGAGDGGGLPVQLDSGADVCAESPTPAVMWEYR